MKIWQATEHDNQLRFYWFATKSEAMAHKRAWEPRLAMTPWGKIKVIGEDTYGRSTGEVIDRLFRRLVGVDHQATIGRS
jgi:hypothetical protein